jgi:hypothetical protein
MPPGDHKARRQRPQVPFPRAGQRLVEAIQVENHVALRRGEDAKVQQVRITSGLDPQAGRRVVRQVFCHHDGRPRRNANGEASMRRQGSGTRSASRSLPCSSGKATGSGRPAAGDHSACASRGTRFRSPLPETVADRLREGRPCHATRLPSPPCRCGPEAAPPGFAFFDLAIPVPQLVKLGCTARLPAVRHSGPPLARHSGPPLARHSGPPLARQPSSPRRRPLESARPYGHRYGAAAAGRSVIVSSATGSVSPAMRSPGSRRVSQKLASAIPAAASRPIFSPSSCAAE